VKASDAFVVSSRVHTTGAPDPHAFCASHASSLLTWFCRHPVDGAPLDPATGASVARIPPVADGVASVVLSGRAIVEGKTLSRVLSAGSVTTQEKGDVTHQPPEFGAFGCFRRGSPGASTFIGSSGSGAACARFRRD